ncbi:MAG: hypothetical protein Q7J24_03750 [Desulfomicrobium sp.]|nr:hypothetical protein [Desulfomicrobium sp.]
MNLEFSEIQKLIQFNKPDHAFQYRSGKSAGLLLIKLCQRGELSRSHASVTLTERDASTHAPPLTRAWQSLGVRTRIPQWLSEKKSKWAVFPGMMHFTNTQRYMFT